MATATMAHAEIVDEAERAARKEAEREAARAAVEAWKRMREAAPMFNPSDYPPVTSPTNSIPADLQAWIARFGTPEHIADLKARGFDLDAGRIALERRQQAIARGEYVPPPIRVGVPNESMAQHARERAALDEQRRAQKAARAAGVDRDAH